MAYVINNDACIGCGECASNCPMTSITQEGDKYIIDADTCISCGMCSGACPQEAISEE